MLSEKDIKDLNSNYPRNKNQIKIVCESIPECYLHYNYVSTILSFSIMANIDVEDIIKPFLEIINSVQPFTELEFEIMEHIVTAHNKFVLLERTHPSEINDWINGIHNLQNILQNRILRRLYPNTFKCIPQIK